MEWRKLDITEQDVAMSLFFRWNDETIPRLSECPGGIAGVTDMLYSEGGILIAENDEYGGIGGYTFGEPRKNFKNKDLAYIYALIIDRKYRGAIFRNFLKTFSDVLAESGVEEVRFKGTVGERVNHLYEKIATPLRVEPNDAGGKSVLYSMNIKDISKYIIP
jgi:hypothetical protein